MDEAAQIPAEIAVAGQKYHMETYLYRDYMPSVGVKKRGVTAIFYLVGKSEQAIQPNLSVTEISMISGDNRVRVVLLDDDRIPMVASDYSDKPGLEATYRSELEWEPGSVVNVILTLTDDKGKTYIIRADNQTIQRVS